MRRAGWVSGVMLLSGIAIGIARAEDGIAKAPVAAPSASASPQASEPLPEGTVIFTFADEAQMQKFAEVWRDRQIIITRMAVLKSYWDEEQVKLNQANDALLSTYHINAKDATKTYSLDTTRRVILEREGAPESPGQTLNPPPSHSP